MTAIAVVAALSAGAWGVSAYRTSQIVAEGREHATAVEEARAQTADVAAGYEQLVAQSTELRDAIAPVADLSAQHEGDFEPNAREALVTAFGGLDARVNEPASTTFSLQAPFDADDLEQAFVTKYRAAEPEEREELATAGATAIESLQEAQVTLDEARAALDAATAEAHQSVMALAQTVPAAAESTAAGHPKATAEAAEALRSSAAFEGWDEVPVEQMTERLGELRGLLEGYVGAATQVRESHGAAVAAEERARQAAAAPRSAGSGGGPSSSGGGNSGRPPRICTSNQWTPSGLILTQRLC
ncbi:hypothetical protein [Aeromicrobium phragmitis]|uniref:hypothetical protein n=1 Tax=Aeromicrobium phragmitis TaxID=2478914 RepID=UPI0010607D49|nr:hypothetical protein [Aeromicrobium phragmitis]